MLDFYFVETWYSVLGRSILHCYYGSLSSGSFTNVIIITIRVRDNCLDI